MADVVIVGAGVVGASIAWHLAQLGVKDVTLLSRGDGSTARATGGFRAQFGTRINVRLSLMAREKLLRFREETGADAGYDPVGYLWLARSQEELAALRGELALQQEEGLSEACLITRDEARLLNPHVAIDEVIGAAFCPSDGVIRPLGIRDGYLQGARVETATVTGLRIEKGRVTKVLGPDVSAGVVVNAAGAWASEICEVPVRPEERHVAFAATELPARMPMTLWRGDGFHLRVRDGQVLLLCPRRTPEQIASIARERVPSFTRIEGSWSGLYEISPDEHAILGRAPGVENLYLANGHSGHGVMHAPALGQLLAEMIVHGRARSLDVHCLRPERFAEGEPLRAAKLSL